MGTNYSAGPFPHRLLAVFKELSLLRVRALMLKFEKMRQPLLDVVRRDELFVSRDEAKRLFKLKIMQTYELFRLMDHEHLGRISMLDLWGALALASLNSPDEKVEFLFNLVDYQRGGYVSRTNLQTLMVCATRGLARLKGIRAPDVRILNKTISVIAGMAFVNENGAISLRDVRVTMLMDENCKAYFAGLGSQVLSLSPCIYTHIPSLNAISNELSPCMDAQVLAMDSGMLVAQRRNIMLDLADVEAQIDQTALRLNIKKEDKEAYDSERGGDISALKISDMKAQVGAAGLKKQQAEAEAAAGDAARVVRPDELMGMPSDEQRLRRMQRAKMLSVAQGTPSLADAAVFRDPSARKKGGDGGGGGGGGGSFDAQAVQRKWSTLRCADDGMCELDIDIVEDLFEAAGVVLTDLEAEECLRAIRPNQLGRRRVEDVIEWYRTKMCTDVPVRVLPLWRKVANDVFESARQAQEAIFRVAAELNTQRAIIDAQAEKDKIVAAMLSEGAAKEAAEPSDATPVVTLGEIQGSQRMVAWQRQQLQSDPALLNWELTFGRPENVPMPAHLVEVAPEKVVEGAAKKNSKMMALLAKEKEKEEEKARAAALDEWERNKWKMSFQFDISIIPPPTSIADRTCFFDPVSLVMKDDVEAPDLLDYFKRTVPATASTAQADMPNSSVAWASFSLKPGASAEDELLLVKLLTNFFESVPYDYRANAYTQVSAKALRIAAPTPKDPDATTRVVLLALLHEEDWFRVIEEKLPPGLLLSRALRKASVHMRGLDSLEDLYKASFPFEAFEDRLFGPQEDELGDEGMNPIRYAKMQRQRHNAIQESVERAFRMSDEELKTHLRDRGLNIYGSHTDLATRARAAFKRQGQINGFGELSAFGADLCARIHKKFLAPKPPPEVVAKKAAGAKETTKAAEAAAAPAPDVGMSLWELNDLLNATGAATIYDRKDYKKVMEEQQLLVDKEGRLLSEGLTAYYELYGRLASDIRKLGVGSLDERLKGEVRASASYEPSAVSTLLGLLEDHNLLQRPLKMLAGLLGSSRDLSLESEFEGVGDLLGMAGLEPLRFLQEFVRSPGWLSSAVHKAAEWLADAEEGVLRSLRNGVFEEFGKYHVWDDAFADFFSTFRVPEHHHFDDTPPIDPQKYLWDRLDDILPPRSNLAEGNSVNKVVALRTLNVRVGEIINDRMKFRLTREQREDLMMLRVKFEARAVEMIKKVEEEKQNCSAHAAALYDGLRRCASGVRHIGCGTKDLTAKSKLVGLDFFSFLPKGVGEAAIPRQLREDKLRRATQRKEAAFNALEREKMRKDKNGPERAAARQKKAEAAQAKRKEEESHLFDEAFKALTVAREERKSATEIGNMVRLWERLQQTKATRYPKSLDAAVSQNNLACVLSEFYGPEHFKGKEAIRFMEAASAAVVTAILAHEPVNAVAEITAPPTEQSSVFIRRKGMAPLSEEELAGYAAAETFIFEVSEEAIVPFLAMLQNYLTVLRLAKGDPRNEDTLDRLFHVRRMVCHLWAALSMKEKDRVKNKVCRPLEGVLVFFMDNVEAQVLATLGEVKAEDESGGALKDLDETSLGGLSELTGTRTTVALDSSLRYKKRATVIGGELGLSREDLDFEVALKRAERQDKEAKMANARRDANILRQQTVRRRNRLYHLITSGEINRVFDLKAGHVLSEGAGINWGTDALPDDPLAFLDSDAGSSSIDQESQSMTTFQTESLATIGEGKKKTKKKMVTYENDDDNMSRGEESLVGGGSLAGVSIASYDESVVSLDSPKAKSEDPSKSENTKPKKGKAGLLSWLFRNRDQQIHKDAPPAAPR